MEGLEDLLKAVNADTCKTLFKDIFDNQLKVAGMEELINSTEFKEIDGKVTINGVPLKDAEFPLKSGRLNEFFKKLKIDKALDEEAEMTLRSNHFNHTPEVHIADLQDEIEKLQKQLNDVKSDDIKNLPESTTSKFSTYFKMAFVGAAATVLGVEMAKTIKRMEGCYLYVKEQDKIKRYKIMQKSHPANRDMPHDGTEEWKNQAVIKLKYNNNLLLRNLYKNQLSPDFLSARDAFKIEFKQDIVDAVNDKNFIIINNANLTKFFENHNLSSVTDSFNLLSNEEKSNRSCVACHSSADIDSIDYVDTSNLPFNYAYRCESNVSLLEAFTKFANQTTADVIDNLTDALGFGGLLPYLAKFALIVLVFVLIGQFLISRYGHLLSGFKKEGVTSDDIEMKPLLSETEIDERKLYR